MWELIKKYWNVWGSTIISFVVAWFSDFTKSSMDVVTSFLSMFLVFFALFTVIKINISNRQKTLVEKGVTSQRQLKLMQQAIDPIAEGEELLETLVKTRNILKDTGRKVGEKMKKFKEFFIWLWGNKVTLASTIGTLFVTACAQIAVYTDYLYQYEFFATNSILVKVLTSILGFAYVVIDLYTTYTKYGCESLTELSAKAEKKVKEKSEQLTSKEKKEIKAKIDILNSAVCKTKTIYDKYLSVIKNYEVLKGTGYVASSEETIAYNNAKNHIEEYKVSLATLDKNIAVLKAKL